MCAINGIFAFHPSAPSPRESELITTRDQMRARGPDGEGIWWSEDRRLGLGHRRLAILDLTESGAQPMMNANGRYVVTFNGEIYNYPELRAELETKGRRFASGSDTEVLLHLYELEGERMLTRLRGMFAFAIWDRDARSLFLARDPYGIKPLYVANDGWTFRFASQVKALMAGGGVSRDPEPAGAVGFFLWGSTPEPFTLYRDVRALPAGSWQKVDASGASAPVTYMTAPQILAEGERVRRPARELSEEVRHAARKSVKAHLLADVEVAVFLSAGIDSGALLGLMRDAGQSRSRAITLAFEEYRGTPEDEAPLAARVAGLYGAEHIVRTVSEAEFIADLPKILAAMDQPSIDGVNTWFVAKAAKEAGLKVALSGLGGDELLAGYPSFREIPRLVAWLRAPAGVPGVGRLARSLALAAGIGARLPKAAGLLEYGGSFAGAYFLRRALFLPHELFEALDEGLVREGLVRLSFLARLRQNLVPKSAQAKIAAMESAQYMRNQLLRDSDWAGMAHGVEIRTPLVDVDLARSLAPFVPGLSATTGKHALANAPSTPLPAEIATRKKTGFGVPTGAWRSRAAHAGRAFTSASKGGASRAWAQEVYGAFVPAIENLAAEQSAPSRACAMPASKRTLSGRETQEPFGVSPSA